MKIQYTDKINEKVIKYYTRMYNAVGLVKIEDRLKWRLQEEETEAKRVIGLEHTLNYCFSDGQKHLIVGSGTGGLAVVLHNKGCLVYGIEPESEANDIIQEKAKIVGLDNKNFTTDIVEDLPFNDNTFDVVHCFTVLEHVNDVKKALSEIVRVSKPNGYIYISSPDYRFPYERHYKMFFPCFLPKILCYLYLIVRGRPWKFFQHINKINEKNINRILYRLPVVWQRVYKSIPKSWDSFRPKIMLSKFFTMGLNIPLNQEIIIRKKELS